MLNPPKPMPFFEALAFAEVFSALASRVPKLVPPFGMAVVRLKEHLAGKVCQLDFQLSCLQQAVFFKSQLYQSFLDHHFEFRFEAAVANHGGADVERLEEVKALIADGRGTDEIKECLALAATMLGLGEEGVKLEFLMSQEERLSKWRAWQPKDPRLQLAPLLVRSQVWKKTAGREFAELVSMLAPWKGAIAHLSHPVLKQLVFLLNKLLAIDSLEEASRSHAEASRVELLFAGEFFGRSSAC
ncbi:unnamed protein product [Effrenium voratum]|uniref:Uncharacterized protein n=1 Tax=Effrenium voratum TaxID=2562239 RepID=A0AA36MHS7_9DINO|nr:unnamed protein product [Effrenium voratum]CAJ1428988.1 unnamed protein product [Effrenium voratum]